MKNSKTVFTAEQVAQMFRELFFVLGRTIREVYGPVEGEKLMVEAEKMEAGVEKALKKLPPSPLVRIIVPTTEEENALALAFLEELMDLDPGAGTPESHALNIQATLIEHFEERYKV